MWINDSSWVSYGRVKYNIQAGIGRKWLDLSSNCLVVEILVNLTQNSWHNVIYCLFYSGIYVNGAFSPEFGGSISWRYDQIRCVLYQILGRFGTEMSIFR